MAQRKLARTIHIGLYEPHDRIVTRMEDYGHNISEVIRNLILEAGDKMFKEDPTYAQAAKISAELRKKRVEAELTLKNMTNEEYAEQVLHGKVRKNGKVGFRIASGQELYIPLNEIKKHNQDNNGFVKIHNSILDRTFLYPGNKQPTEAEFESMLKDWEDLNYLDPSTA